MRFLTLFLIPYALMWLLARNRRRLLLWSGLAGIAMMQLFSILPFATVGYAVVAEANATPADDLRLAGLTSSSAKLASLYDSYTVTQGQLHGLVGWEGVDIKAGCGKPIYAPFAGTVTYNGLDGYNHEGIYEQATMITIVGSNLELTLLHGDYTAQLGSKVQSGDILGRENSRGWSTGCHSHVILKENGRLLNFLEWQKTNQPLSIYHADYPLRISWYDPSLGGTNCDSDCSTMASGDSVASWVNGKGGIFAAACPRSNGWHHGLRFELDGVTYECRDTGGYINCYQPGIYDPALKRQASESYCWVDLLNGSHYSYGSLAYDWGFILHSKGVNQ